MKKFLKITVWLILSVLYLLYIGYSIQSLPMNSDSATMILYADDILNGNIFLSGWDLTGITYITTDLPFYIISTAIFGVGVNSFRFSVFLMYIFMSLAGVGLCVYGVRNKSMAISIALAIGLFPTTYALSNTFVHTAVFGLMFLAMLLVSLYNNGSKLALFGLVIVTALATAGDGLSLMLIFLPIVVMALFRAFEKNFSVVLSVSAGTVLGLLIQKVFIYIGGAELNSISHSTFLSVSGFYNSIINYIECVLRLINAFFFSKPMFSVKTAVFAVKLGIAVFAFYIVYLSVKAVLKRKETDIPTAGLGLGFGIISLVMIFTTLNANVTAGRYFAYLPLMLAIAIARCVDIFPIINNKKIYFLIILLCIPLAGTNIISAKTDISTKNTYSKLADFIVENHLETGFASFWDSSAVTVYSNNKVNLRSVICNENGVQPHRWFSKQDWYKTDADFIVVRKDGAKDDEFRHNMNGIFNMRLDCSYLYGSFDEQLNGITYKNVIKHIGKPNKEIPFENYVIMIYDKIKLN